MKVEAKIKSGGEWLTTESLNYPGQTFTGTVTENLIEGVFEMNHERYYGSYAPVFPFDYSADTMLTKYLEPEYLIESDHPQIGKKAKEITEGATNSWDASIKLSKWVAENIHGAIPGGTSAIGTFETRSGECGSHSRLMAALCRSVGIPAKLATGCMYINHYGGSFGQHVWNEVYMGDAGWVSIDATISEFDYIDCGHIKLGELTTFNPIEMKILGYRVGYEEVSIAEKAIPEKYKKYIGDYNNPRNGNILELCFEDDALAVMLPNQTLLKLNEPNEMGNWYSQITDQLYFSFSADDLGTVNSMLLTQIIPVPRKSADTITDTEAPAEFAPYLGSYYSMQLRSEFKILYLNNSLAVDDPNAGMLIGLAPPDENGIWKDEFGEHAIGFDRNDEGEVIAMKIYQNVVLNRVVTDESAEIIPVSNSGDK